MPMQLQQPCYNYTMVSYTVSCLATTLPMWPGNAKGERYRQTDIDIIQDSQTMDSLSKRTEAQALHADTLTQ